MYTRYTPKGRQAIKNRWIAVAAIVIVSFLIFICVAIANGVSDGSNKVTRSYIAPTYAAAPPVRNIETIAPPKSEVPLLAVRPDVPRSPTPLPTPISERVEAKPMVTPVWVIPAYVTPDTSGLDRGLERARRRLERGLEEHSHAERHVQKYEPAKPPPKESSSSKSSERHHSKNPPPPKIRKQK